MSHWTEFLEETAEAYKALNLDKNDECFYRGHSNSTWPLSPSLLRGMPASKMRTAKFPVISMDRWYTESNLYYEFRSRARELEVGLTDWDVLFFMQHYRVRTRLLDWTESFGVALYFALNDYNPEVEQPCIWLMNPYSYNLEFGQGNDLWEPSRLDKYGEDEPFYSYSDLLLGNYHTENRTLFYWDTPVALYPARRNNRLTNQAGYFTIHGNNVAPLDIICTNEKILRKVIIPHQAVAEGREFLKLAGINHFSMFPDLEGLATYLNVKYF
jgi:hypothetical protein